MRLVPLGIAAITLAISGFAAPAFAQYGGLPDQQMDGPPPASGKPGLSDIQVPDEPDQWDGTYDQNGADPQGGPDDQYGVDPRGGPDDQYEADPRGGPYDRYDPSDEGPGDDEFGPGKPGDPDDHARIGPQGPYGPVDPRAYAPSAGGAPLDEYGHPGEFYEADGPGDPADDNRVGPDGAYGPGDPGQYAQARPYDQDFDQDRDVDQDVDQDRDYDPENQAGPAYGRQSYGYHEPPPPDPRARTWQGEDGRTYCRRSDGTTGAIVGGGAGALIGYGIDSRGERGTGTIIGSVLGALLGSAVERNSCR